MTFVHNLNRAIPLLLMASLLTAQGWAHDTMASWTIARPVPEGWELTIKIAAETAWPFVQEISPTATFEPEHLDASRPLLSAAAQRFYELTLDGRPLVATSSGITLAEDYFEFHVLYPRSASGRLRLKARYLERMSPEFTAHLTVQDLLGKVLASKLVTARDPSLELPSTDSRSVPAASSWSRSFREFLVLGIEHILTGYDHLLFLCGLLVACRRLSSIVAIITCFTLAHSITLALSALNLISLSSRVIEPTIAATIIFVGVENLLRNEPTHRWLLTFVFGLVHGFGFASVLKEIGLGSSGASLLVPLFSFNLGVELGQLTVAALVVPIFWKLKDVPHFERYGRPAISLLVAFAGVYWFLQRTVFA